MSGFSVLLAADGIAALRIVERHTPDAFVIDLGLPLMSGTAVIDELHVSPTMRRIPIVVVTGMNVEAPAHAAATLIKPIEPHQLAEEVRRVLRPMS